MPNLVEKRQKSEIHKFDRKTKRQRPKRVVMAVFQRFRILYIHFVTSSCACTLFLHIVGFIHLCSNIFKCHLIGWVFVTGSSLLVAATVLEPVVSAQPPTQTQTDTLTKCVKSFKSYDEEELL